VLSQIATHHIQGVSIWTVMLPLLSSAPESRSEGFRVAGSLFSASGVTLLQLAGRLVALTFTLALRRHYSQQPAAAEIPRL
jgi:hypothetical protein